MLLLLLNHVVQSKYLNDDFVQLAFPSQSCFDDARAWIMTLVSALQMDVVATINGLADLDELVELQYVRVLQLLLLGTIENSVPQLELFLHGATAVWIYQFCLIEHHDGEAFRSLHRV